MKALVILGLLVCGSTAQAQKFIRIGTEVAGSHRASFRGDTDKQDVADGFSIAVEGVRRIESVGLGAGVEYQIAREVKGFEGHFNFVPIYALARLYLGHSSNTQPYLGVRAGYNLFFGDDTYRGGEDNLTGGAYFGFGGGVEFRKFFVEAGFSQNSGTFTLFNSDLSIEYSKLNLGFGMKF